MEQHFPDTNPPSNKQKHQWAWAYQENGTVAVKCDGDVLFVTESLEKLGKQLKSGEMEP